MDEDLKDYKHEQQQAQNRIWDAITELVKASAATQATTSVLCKQFGTLHKMFWGLVAVALTGSVGAVVTICLKGGVRIVG